MKPMNFEARYVDARARDAALTVAPVTAIWCVLNGRMRRFTVENVRDTKAAGHRFYVSDARGANWPASDVHVIGGSSEAFLHSDIDGIAPNQLANLPGREA